jgi:hypothetical protein
MPITLKLSSLHFVPPDFLWSSVALIKCVRLSLRKGAFVALLGPAWQEIRVRFGRDDNFRFAFFWVIATTQVMPITLNLSSLHFAPRISCGVQWR